MFTDYFVGGRRWQNRPLIHNS